MFVWNKVKLKVKINDINAKSKQAVKGTKSLLNKLISIQTPNLKVAQMFKIKHVSPEQAFKKPETKMRLKEELKSLLASYEAFPSIHDNYSIKKSASVVISAKDGESRTKPKHDFIHKSFEKPIRQTIWLNKGNNNQSMHDVLYKNKNKDQDLVSPDIDYYNSLPQQLGKGSKTHKYMNRAISTRHYFLIYTPLTKKIKLNRSQLVNINTTFDLSQFTKNHK